MLELKCNIIKIYCVKGSFLEVELINRSIPYYILPEKEQLIDQLKIENYDYLISNGCPYILPISTLTDEKKIFINIHPSYLPDMRGKHPVNGVLLYGREYAGVTCHLMDDGIDTGKPLSRVKVPITNDIELPLLYQILFRSEGDAFKQAYDRNFEPIDDAHDILNPLYYSRDEGDMIIYDGDKVDIIIAKIRAFQSPGLYAKYCKNRDFYNILSVNEIINEFVKSMFRDERDNTILINMPLTNSVLVKYHNSLLQLTFDRPLNAYDGEIFLEKDGQSKR